MKVEQKSVRDIRFRLNFCRKKFRTYGKMSYCMPWSEKFTISNFILQSWRETHDMKFIYSTHSSKCDIGPVSRETLWFNFESNTCDQSDEIHDPTAFDSAMAQGPVSHVAWCGGFSFGLHSVSLVDEQLTDLDLMPIPQVAEHWG